MISKWQGPAEQNRVWLMYSANYLFRTGGVRWAIDPLTLARRVPSASPVNASHDLRGLSFVLLTHRHNDHLDLQLISELSPLPILWVVPADLLESVRQAGVPSNQIIIPHSMETLQIEGLLITPFEGQHWEVAPERPAGRRGVPSTGYLLEFNGRRWLFPGDTRTYNAGLLPSFEALDGVLVHLWLGRASALLNEPPLLDAFCQFCLDLHAPRLVITHLHEFGRPPEECWEDRHFELVRQRIQDLSPQTCLLSAQMGECVEL